MTKLIDLYTISKTEFLYFKFEDKIDVIIFDALPT